jgi:endonuclease YncB( thermonuclease family)
MPAEVAFPRMYPGSVVVEVVDADSVRVQLDLGFDLSWRVLCRLHGIAAREKNEPGGLEAREHLAGIIPPGTLVDVLSVKYDKYSGRVLTVLFHGVSRVDVGAQMVRDGYAAPWNGVGVQPKPPWPLVATGSGS